MLKITYECDLCKKKSAITSTGHSGAIINKNPSLNYGYTDQVNFPPGWVNIGSSAICEQCFDLTKGTKKKNT